MFHARMPQSGIHSVIFFFLCLDTESSSAQVQRNNPSTKLRTRLPRNHLMERMRDIYYFKKLDLSVALFPRDDNRYCLFLNAIFEMPIKSLSKTINKKENNIEIVSILSINYVTSKEMTV